VFDLTFALTALVSDHVTIRGGYTFLFLGGLALATDQLDSNPTLKNSRDFIADKGTMTLQGPFAGAEIARYAQDAAHSLSRPAHQIADVDVGILLHEFFAPNVVQRLGQTRSDTYEHDRLLRRGLECNRRGQKNTQQEQTCTLRARAAISHLLPQVS
jgi:hypothetical protein